MILDAWGWCTGMAQRDGIGREEGGGFRMANTTIPRITGRRSGSLGKEGAPEAAGGRAPVLGPVMREQRRI